MRGFQWSALWVPTWPPWEIVLRATLVYAFVLVLFRIVGRKELSRYAAHDMVLLFLIATATRQTMVGTDTSVTSGFVALATIVLLDTLASYLSFRSRRFATVIDGRLRALISNGVIDDEELRRSRISRDELVALLRRHGRSDLAEVKHAFLERSGRVTFLLAPPAA